MIGAVASEWRWHAALPPNQVTASASPDPIESVPRSGRPEPSSGRPTQYATAAVRTRVQADLLASASLGPFQTHALRPAARHTHDGRPVCGGAPNRRAEPPECSTVAWNAA
jgi:hypothetical protein